MYLIDSNTDTFFKRLVEFISFEFKEEHEITNDYSRTDGIWILTYNSFVIRVQDIIEKNGCSYIVIQTEPKEKFEKQGYKEFLDKAIKVYNYHENFQIGYSQFWRLENESTKDIDILFVGKINDMRMEILNKINNVQVETNLYGKELINTINRSKIVLSIRYYKGNNEDWERIPYLVSNKIFVIGERYENEKLNSICDKAGIVLVDREKIVETCEYYLNNPLKRLEAVDKAFDYFKNNYKTEFM